MLAQIISRSTRKLKIPILIRPHLSTPPQNPTSYYYFSSKTSSSSSDDEDDDSQKSFTISYLINSCGLSPNDAVSISKKVTIKSPKKTDAVLKLLTNYGFTITNTNHIPKLVKRWPTILLSSPEKNLLPKFKFFCSLGIPPTTLADKISVYPNILQRSLDKYLVPTYAYLKSIVESDENVATFFSRVPKAFAHGWQGVFPTNIAMLRSRGLSESSIAKLVMYQPTLTLLEPDKMSCFVDKAEEMGFDKTKMVFIHALKVFGNMSETTMERKMEVYRKCGWSESDIRDLFLRFPLSMAFSEKKIVANLDFFLNEIGCEPCDIITSPAILGMSLEKRMRPRWLVFGILNSKKLLKRTSKFTTLFSLSEKRFLRKFVTRYEKDIPKLLDFYQGKMSYDELEKKMLE